MVDGKKRSQPSSGLEGSVKSATVHEKGLSLVVRVTNPGERALHYVSELRGLKYDTASKTLTVLLSDASRELLAGPGAIIPKMKSVDPNSVAEFALELPASIVKLASTPSPPDSIAFERQNISEATTIKLNISWSDTPYYEDHRPTDDQRTGIERWKKADLEIVHTMAPAGSSETR